MTFSASGSWLRALPGLPELTWRPLGTESLSNSDPILLTTSFHLNDSYPSVHVPSFCTPPNPSALHEEGILWLAPNWKLAGAPGGSIVEPLPSAQVVNPGILGLSPALGFLLSRVSAPPSLLPLSLLLTLFPALLSQINK